MSYLLRDAYLSLQPDRWRMSNPFNPDIDRVNEILFHPYASYTQKSKALRFWMQKNQLCVFGRIASSMDRIHLCLLSETDFYKPDEEIADFIGVERNRWKLRCLRNDMPEHGFLLLASSPRIALASPNTDLQTFSKVLRGLYGPEIEKHEKGNDIAWEYLYLKHPQRDICVRFKFSLDYFASQGDGRWWHDHRIPGGVAYTANSVGHMTRVREWYENKGSQLEWVIKVAMETVDEAADTTWGKAIKLRPLNDGRPFRGNKCPFATLSSLKPRLQAKDWSAYEGTISTDHSLRRELFQESPNPPDDLPRWNQDLSYLYDDSNPAHAQFVPGQEVSYSEVIGLLGDPSERPILASLQVRVDPDYLPFAPKLMQMQEEWGLTEDWG
jgi:hypothetical protein